MYTRPFRPARWPAAVRDDFESSPNESLLSEIREKCRDADIIVTEFDWDMIVAGTDNFSDLNLVARGKSGTTTIHMASLGPSGKFAVKRFSPSSGIGGLTEFKNEIFLLPKLEHPNIIKLIGYCIHGQEKLLVHDTDNMSREYNLKMKTDIYCFGVIVLVIMSGKMVTTVSEVASLIDNAKMVRSIGTVSETVEDSLIETYVPDEARKCLEVGILCTQQDPDSRPTITSVLKILRGSETAELGRICAIFTILVLASSRPQGAQASTGEKSHDPNVLETELGEELKLPLKSFARESAVL
ncbi:PREDICTED: cysteine-rich receptor-like protein kinase 19 [Erythranthe guttata]|uniref:cysteine-rich receptor-like protein kinase 19 n=1 Tax=Erythranthe guttata TaxID=4155 RepID=UPI00064D75BD|nr:PREDICTED: cysteine-rich receptor-like protein kinase 19 [Erythranthe guttata]|eukprot:XP_012834071.1 PREDICTED: cysteine-rich receptor-like protein kinase 19 [Erythranthe guttata]